MFQNVVGELVFRGFQDNALEVFGLDVAITVLVEDVESLADTLPLQASKHLRELRVGHVMATFGASGVQGGPIRVPVEGNAVLVLVHVIQVLEGFPLHGTCAVGIEQTEGDLIFGIGLREEVLEGCPIAEAELASLLAIRNLEEDSVMFTLDFMLERANCDVS